jgi:hypothetical protein
MLAPRQALQWRPLQCPSCRLPENGSPAPTSPFAATPGLAAEDGAGPAETHGLARAALAAHRPPLHEFEQVRTSACLRPRLHSSPAGPASLRARWSLSGFASLTLTFSRLGFKTSARVRSSGIEQWAAHSLCVRRAHTLLMLHCLAPVTVPLCVSPSPPNLPGKHAGR